MSTVYEPGAAFLKRILLTPLVFPGLAEVLANLTNTQFTIFMLHRFSVPELGVSGHNSQTLRRTLAHLRKQRFKVLALQELLDMLRRGETLRRAVAFTIDDGYFDQAQIAAPVFAEFDWPVTTFVATGFLDGKTWFWWDKLEQIFESTRRTGLKARLGNEKIHYRLDTQEARSIACEDLNLRCQDALEEHRIACIIDLSREAEVELPITPPPKFAPLTWSEARRLESRGMTFGPHTVSHPVLSTTSDEQAEFEIAESWKRLKAEVSRPVPIFCYPNGRSQDSGEREIAIIRRTGLSGAVIGQPVDVRPADFRKSAITSYRVPRFPYSDSLLHVLQCVSGVEMVKSRIRMSIA